MHLLSSDKISFSMAICCKCLEYSVVFPVDIFWCNLFLMFPLLPFSWNSEVFPHFLNFLHSVNERQVVTHKIIKYGGTGLSMNILRAGDKSFRQRGFSTNSAGDLWPALKFLGGLYNFCNLVIIFSYVNHKDL